jgi:hypothetical protein
MQRVLLKGFMAIIVCLFVSCGKGSDVEVSEAHTVNYNQHENETIQSETMALPLEDSENTEQESFYPYFVYFDSADFEYIWGEVPEPTHAGYRWVVPPVLDSIQWFQDGFFKVFIDGHSPMIIDKTERAIIPPFSDERFLIRNIHDIGEYRIAVVEFDDKYGVIDMATSQVLVPFIYSSLTVQTEYDIAIVRVEGEHGRDWGIVELATGREIVPHGIYENIFLVGEELASVTIGEADERRIGFVNVLSGELAIPTIYSGRINDFSDCGLIMVRYGDKWGFIDRTGEVIIPFMFDPAFAMPNGRWHGFNNGFAGVSRNGLTGVIDRTGSFTVSPQYHRFGTLGGVPATYMLHDMAIVARPDIPGNDHNLNPRGVVNIRTGEYVVPRLYSFIEYRGEGMVWVSRGNMILNNSTIDSSHITYGLINLFTGETIELPALVEGVHDFENGIAVTWGNWGQFESVPRYPGYGLMYKNGEEIFPPIFTTIRPLSDNTFAVARNARDGSGLIEFEGYEPFYEYYTALLDWGIIDITGRSITTASYCYIRPDADGLAVVNVGGGWYEGPISGFSNIRGGSWGIIDALGNEIIPPIFQSIGGGMRRPPYHDGTGGIRQGLVFVQRDGKWGLIEIVVD